MSRLCTTELSRYNQLISRLCTSELSGYTELISRLCTTELPCYYDCFLIKGRVAMNVL